MTISLNLKCLPAWFSGLINEESSSYILFKFLKKNYSTMMDNSLLKIFLLNYRFIANNSIKEALVLLIVERSDY
jgi:hypothetical protein